VRQDKFRYQIFICTIIFLASACTQIPSEKDLLTYGLTLSPSGIDPHINASAELSIPLSSVYDTLVFQDPDTGEFVPGLAKSWSISLDGLTYTFFLRRDVIFHDGTRFNAQAVLANIEYTLNPDHHSQKAIFMLGPLEKVQVIDDYTVALHLSEPFAPLLDSLSQVYLGMASPKALTQWGPSQYQFHQVGTGPYRFMEYIPNDYITLVRNPDYMWGPKIYHNDKAQIQMINFRFFEDTATRTLALESGRVDIIGELPPQDASRLGNSDEIEIYQIHIPGQPLQFIFNTLQPPTDDLRVRDALVRGVDRAKIVEIVFGLYSPVAQGPLSANAFGFTPDQIYPEYDYQSAVDLLESAGWIDADGDGLRMKQGEAFKLLLVAPDWGSNVEVCQLIAYEWKELGAEVEIRIVPSFGPLKEAQVDGEYNAIGMNSFGTDPDLLRSFYASDGIFNWSGYRSEELDRLLNEAATHTNNPAAREALYALVFQKILENRLILPIRDYVNLVGVRSDIRDPRFSYQGWYPYLIDLSFSPNHDE